MSKNKFLSVYFSNLPIFSYFFCPYPEIATKADPGTSTFKISQRKLILMKT